MASERQPLLSVEDALERALAGLPRMDAEELPLEQCHGRILAEDIKARITQPPFDASAMDGYAVRGEDVSSVPANLKVIGESAAGHPFEGSVSAGEAVRIFTGGSVPEGADSIVIQEDTRRDDDTVTINEAPEPGAFVRPRGFDFSEGDILLSAGSRLTARDLTLAATMNVTTLSVRRRPVVAILATGDELVRPGTPLKPGQIVSSIPYGIEAMVRAAGGEPIRLGIAADNLESLSRHIAEAKQADVLLTIGGASVGEHDLVQEALGNAGMELDFWRIAMRPGKPLMFGSMGSQRVLGVPGNPVSALVCSRIFLLPMIWNMLSMAGQKDQTAKAHLLDALEANGSRQHYMRATFERLQSGELGVKPVRSQDSSLLSPLAQADCLIVREPDSPAAAPGDEVRILLLDF